MVIPNLAILTGRTKNGRPTVRSSEPPRSRTGCRPIQLPYLHAYSIWAYAQHFDEIDWVAVIGPRCPICGQHWCWRRITAYVRGVVELFPFRKGTIPVARFLCGTTGRTFSLLPYELAPYHIYTVESMVMMMLLVVQVREEDGTGVGTALEEAPHECDVTPWLIACWAGAVVRGFRRGHHELVQHFDLGAVRSRRDPLVEVAHYCRASILTQKRSATTSPEQASTPIPLP